MTERLIGIDFGTSTTVVHIKNYTDGRPSDGDGTSIQYVEFDGQGMVPSLIQKVDDTYYFGYDAKQPKKDEKIYRNFKMKLESSDEKEQAEAEKLTLYSSASCMKPMRNRRCILERYKWRKL